MPRLRRWAGCAAAFGRVSSPCVERNWRRSADTPLRRARAIKSGTVRTPKRIASATAQAAPGGLEGRWKLAGGDAPGFLRRSEMRPGRGEGNPRHDSGTLPGCVARLVGFRGYRCAQPPANTICGSQRHCIRPWYSAITRRKWYNIRQPCRADGAWCLRAAFLRPAATRSADAQARRAGIFVETPSIWPQAPYGAKWLPGFAA